VVAMAPHKMGFGRVQAREAKGFQDLEISRGLLTCVGGMLFARRIASLDPDRWFASLRRRKKEGCPQPTFAID
jgi:hypothetical protein